MNYKYHSAKDLALDEKFQKWVLSPDHETNVFWANWVAANPDRKNDIDKARQLVLHSGLSSDFEANKHYLQAWKNISDHVQKARTKRMYRYAGVAAAFSGVVLVAGYLIFSRFAASNEVQHQTTYGETKEVSLPDGSTVLLNANSSIMYEDNWNTKQGRKIFLTGEAFFNVAKTPDKKSFEVQAGNVNVKVLGTEFNVQARREKVSVYLQSGKVNVISPEGNASLSPGEGTVIIAGKAPVIKKFDGTARESLLDWKNGQFVFNDSPLSEVAWEIEDNYGFRVILSDMALGQKRITAKVGMRDVDVLLAVLAETLELKVERDENRIMISPSD